MKNIMLVGVGGFAGSVARYLVSGWLFEVTAQQRFPYGTFVVNVLGCFFAGVLAGLAERFDLLGPEARLLLLVGLLGGFTTFSAFSLESMSLLRRGELTLGVFYIVASVVFGAGAVWLGAKGVSAAYR
ncbi:MAG: fluoride efflux transporter CrcB [Gammaproteobacteria bacterium]|nr:fluoride efflux transporter CrcB [Gammaproteobacteria bacterium]